MYASMALTGTVTHTHTHTHIHTHTYTHTHTRADRHTCRLTQAIQSSNNKSHNAVASYEYLITRRAL